MFLGSSLYCLFQTVPLDLPTDTFYITRRDAIEERLQYLAQLSPSELFLECLSLCSRIYPSGILRVTWRWLDMVCSTARGRRWWLTFRHLLNFDIINSRCSKENNPRLSTCTGSKSQTVPSNTITQSALIATQSSSLHHSKSGNNQIPKSCESIESLGIISTPPRKPQHVYYNINQPDFHHSPVSTRTSSFTSPITSPPSGTYRNIPTSVSPIDQIVFISSIVAGFGSRSLVVILRTFCQAFAIYKSGLPDLTMWRTSFRWQRRHQIQSLLQQNSPSIASSPQTQLRFKSPHSSPNDLPMLDIKLAEVKSENDRLSEKQR